MYPHFKNDDRASVLRTFSCHLAVTVCKSAKNCITLSLKSSTNYVVKPSVELFGKLAAGVNPI